MSKLDTLEPGFREKVARLIERTELATGRKWGISDGRRTMAQQKAIYDQPHDGKDNDHDGKIDEPDEKVSNAPPGYSAHNFGLAADLWPLTAKGDFDWNASRSLFRVMVQIAEEELGLTSGIHFKTIPGGDAPHVEDPSWKTVQAAWEKGEVQVA